MLAEASPIVCEPRAYALAVQLGFAGSPRLAHRFTSAGLNWADALQVETVVFEGARFKVACHEPDQRGAVAAFVFAGRNADSEIIDAVAVDPATDRAAALLGNVGTLGLPNLYAPRLASPLMVLESASEWIKSARGGLVILNAALAADELAGVTLGVEDRAAAFKLHSRLAAHCHRPLQIVVRKAVGRRYG